MYLNNTAYLDGATAGKINLIAGDVDDYIQFYSSANNPYIGVVGGGRLHIPASVYINDGGLSIYDIYTDIGGYGITAAPMQVASGANSEVSGVKGFVQIGDSDSFSALAAEKSHSIGLSFGNHVNNTTTDDGAGNKGNWIGSGMELWGLSMQGTYIAEIMHTGILRGDEVTAAKIQPLQSHSWGGTITSGATIELNDTYGVKLLASDTSVFAFDTITNEYLLYIEKPDIATNNYQVYLEGTGAGTGIWFGSAAHRAYSDGTDFYLTGLTNASATPLEYNTSTKKVTYDSSARKYKENIRDFSDNFRLLLDIQPKRYTRKSDGANEIGYIADDLHDLGLNNLVGYKDGEPEFLNRKTIQLYMLEIVKDHDKRIKRLEVIVCILSFVLLVFLLYFFLSHVRGKCQKPKKN